MSQTINEMTPAKMRVKYGQFILKIVLKTCVLILSFYLLFILSIHIDSVIESESMIPEDRYSHGCDGGFCGGDLNKKTTERSPLHRQEKHINIIPDTKYEPPKKEIPAQRFPQAVIIGFRKCGTRSLLSAIGLNPYVRITGPEPHFYDEDKDNFQRGYKWYREQMPFTYSDQVTIEKTPSYVLYPRAVKEMKKEFPKVKVIAVVCNPVDRLLSDHVQLLINNKPTSSVFRKTLKEWYTSPTDGSIDPALVHVNTGYYHAQLKKWFAAFNRKQLLIVDGKRLKTDPLAVAQEFEVFLGVPSMLSNFNFVRNQTSGFYCYREFGEENPNCFTSKGRQHEVLPDKDRKELEDHYMPHNKALYSLVNKTFDWDSP